MKSNRNFIFLMLGQSVANIGDVLYIVAIISVLYKLTQSATVSSFVPFSITFAMFISSILTPLLIEKFNLKSLLLSSQIGKTVLLIGLGIFMMNSLNSRNYYLIFIIIVGVALLDGCANPIKQTLIPYYVEDNLLIKANGISETMTQSIQIGTWFFGSLLLIVFNANQLIWFVMVLFSISSILLSFLNKVEYEAENQEQKWTVLTRGWKSINHNPLLGKVVWMEFLETVASSVWIAAILYVFVEKALKVQEQWWGFINSSFFIGLVLGSILCIKFSRLVDEKRNVFIMTGALMTCVCTILFGTTSVPVMALILSTLIGLFGQLKNIPQQTLIQTSVSKEQLATVYTSIGTISTGVFGVSSLVMGLISDYFGVRSVFILSGILLAIVSLITFKNRKLFVKDGRRQSSSLR
ncbi:MFS transporter [Terrilactibacillus laevilacticus]|uniref:MFS transporter n=1 Tax=Terrilactibacillus laevilacticus TaxID=1380157 RepID=A0ABW5PKM3_9BACI|nr:MFS transporter [Terrilactibacillus laevilacticus]